MSRLFGSGVESLPLPEPAFKLLRDLIVEHTGVFFDDGKRLLLADKLSDLAIDQGLTSFVEYYYLLRYDDQADAHWRRLMDRLAVPETFFFRQSEQLDALVNTIVPMLKQARGTRPLRIWSAGCCSGEEPLSIAMALDEAGLLEPGAVEIVATDGSGMMLDRARRASYGGRAFRQMPDAVRARYFRPLSDGTWRPIDRLLRAIHYGLVNLADHDEVASQPVADVIFCRNVFIYFSDDAIRRAVHDFEGRLADDGYLFLGAAESLTRLGVSWELAEVDGSFVYVKPGRRAIVEAAARAWIGSPAHGRK
ncbi:MAG TPA: protein-glutamate O-methyltransferase CheR [Gemmatimonadaceae bacterium]|nr:protein-glutamate O-methyltransferase CheR [Gemmatimonadaceae bacterium]